MTETKNNKIKIVRIELTPVFMPFKEFIKQVMQSGEGGLGMAIPAEEAWLGGDFVVCKLIADSGHVGIGEAFVWLPETGISPAGIIDAVKNGLGVYVLGESPFNVERVRNRMDRNVAQNDVPKGLLDMACYDLMGRITNLPAHCFMGGAMTDKVPLTALIPLCDMDTMLGLAKGFVASGARTVRVKLGRGVSEDVEIMRKMRETLGANVRMRVDYNQAYSPIEAVRAIKAIEPFGVDSAEQPVKASDYLGMAWVQKRVETPLMAHESSFSLRDIITMIELNAIGVVGINAERPGGVTNALRAISYAEQRGMGVILHNQPLGISSAAQIHLGAARYASLGHAMELFGHIMFEDDLIVEPNDYSGGFATVPKGAGWGVELDEEALSKYATAPAAIIE